MDAKRCLYHVYEVLDVEYDMLQMTSEELRSQGKSFAADDIDNAREDLLTAILGVKKSWKFLENDQACEQLKMDI